MTARILKWKWLLIVPLVAASAAAKVVPEEPVQTLEDVEDVRLLFCLASYRIHELETLLRYARGFGADEFAAAEAREWHLRALRIFEPLKSLDDAGQALMAWVDFKKHDVDITGNLAIIRGLLGECAAQTVALYRDLDERIASVRTRLAELTREKGLEAPAVHGPIPWDDPHREIGRRMGHTLAWFYWMNERPESRHAALDRQQGLTVDYLLGKATKLGIRAIVPEFPSDENEESCSWRVVEAKEGAYDFSRIDADIAAVARHGLKVIVPIRSLTTDPPAWAMQKMGDESRLWRYDQKQQKAVPTTGINLFDPRTRDAFLKYVGALARHLREQHAGQVIALLAEVRATKLPADVDYSPAAYAHFRQWLKDRYGDINKVNGLWGTACKSFDEVQVPAPAGATSCRSSRSIACAGIPMRACRTSTPPCATASLFRSCATPAKTAS